jgi:predicted nucleotide-binding protein
LGWLGEVPNDPKQTLSNQVEYKLKYLGRLSDRAELFDSDASQSKDNIISDKGPQSSINTNEVFIVHGHDDTAKVKVALFLERLKLKSIILHEQTNLGKTIIEKIEAYTNVGFAVVLYTQCDVGGKDSQILKPRARQNVVFEHGYLIGKIGRSKVCALVKGNIETPSDISGVVYTPMDDNDGWHLKLACELKASGYTIDMNML